MIERYRTCETAAQVAEMQEQIISDAEAEYTESRRKGKSDSGIVVILTSSCIPAREEENGDLLVANPNHAGRSRYLESSSDSEDSETSANASADEEMTKDLESKISSTLILEP